MTHCRTKILFLIPSLSAGGAERVIVNLLRHLDKTRFMPVLAVVNLRSEVFLDDVPADVELIDLQCTRVRFAVFKIIRLIWKIRPRVLFSTLGYLNLLLAIIKPCCPKNIHYLCRESTILSEGIKNYSSSHYFDWANLFRRFYKRFDKIICQSTYMRDDLNSHFGIPMDKLVVIHNPVDTARIRRLAAELPAIEMPGHNAGGHGSVINLVSAGRMVKTKGFDLLIEALAINRNPRVYLTLLGDGPLKEVLQSLAKQLGIEQQIRFVGFQKNPYAFIARADAYVLSSLYEGFPNVVLESLTCGTPVIATPALGGSYEILNGVEGCLIAESLSAEGLAKALSIFTFGKRLPPEVVAPYAMERIVGLYEQQFTYNDE